MRLLDTETGQFIEIVDVNQVEYAILSHTWDPKGEQSYQDLREIQKSYAISDTRHAFPVASSMTPRTPSPKFPSGHDGSLMSTISQPSLLSSRKTSKTSLFLQRMGGHNRSNSSISSSLSGVTLTEHSSLSIWDDPRLSKKIRQACTIARAYGHRLIWIDSCCIDKTSSSELSEAINSMFQWYRDASVCYAFLADVPAGEDPQIEDSHFRRSRWFTRGWTLQELIAPRVVIFLTQGWHFLGAKSSMVNLVEEVTSIDRAILTHDMRLDQISVARRMSWASRRVTTRMEDEAYALLGLFDISMPTLYGEGRRAFVRLQQAIMMQIPDQSLFAWATAHHTLPVSLPFSEDGESATQVAFEEVYGGKCATLFADAPWRFYTSKLARPLPYAEFVQRLGISSSEFPPPRYAATPYGVETHFPLIPVTRVIPESAIIGSSENWYFAVLACESSHNRELIAITCTVTEHPQTGVLVLKGGGMEYQGSQHIVGYRLVALSPNKIKQWDPEVKTLYVPLENPRDTTTRFMISTLAARKQNPVIRLAKWSARTLRESGYVVTREPSDPANLCLSISKNGIITDISLPAAPRLEYRSGNIPITVKTTRASSEDGVVTYDDTQTLEFIKEAADFSMWSSSGEDLNMRIMLHNTTESSFYLDIEILPRFSDPSDTDELPNGITLSRSSSIADIDAPTGLEDIQQEGEVEDLISSEEGDSAESGGSAAIMNELQLPESHPELVSLTTESALM